MKPSLAMATTSALAFLLTGCQESAVETANDVAEERHEAAQEIAKAENELNQFAAAANGDAKSTEQVAKARYSLALEEAEGRYEVATERCDAMNERQEKEACWAQAKADFDIEKLAAAAQRDAAVGHDD